MRWKEPTTRVTAPRLTQAGSRKEGWGRQPRLRAKARRHPENLSAVASSRAGRRYGPVRDQALHLQRINVDAVAVDLAGHGDFVAFVPFGGILIFNRVDALVGVVHEYHGLSALESKGIP